MTGFNEALPPMNRLRSATIVVILTAGALALAGCSPKQDAAISDSQKSAIQSVFAQRAKLRSDEAQMGLLGDRELAGLMAVDVQNCPPDFQSAWFDYLVEGDNLHTRMKRVAALALAEGKPVTDLPSLIKFAGSNLGLSQYLLGVLNDVDRAWMKVERTAMTDGVMPESSDPGGQPNAALESGTTAH
jgi:hypothetical protein